MSANAGVCVVTGGSGGIGTTVVDRCLESGHRVAVVDRNPPNRADDARVAFFGCDVSDEESSASAYERIVAWAEQDPITGLVAMAGTSVVGGVLELPLDGWRLAINTYLTGTFIWARLAAGTMPDGGSIVTTGSITGERAFPTRVAYGVAKAGVHQLTRSLAVELADRGVRANCVVPGYVRTPRLAEVTRLDESKIADLHGLGRLGSPGEVAEVVAFLLGESSSFITGELLHVDGGYSAMSRPRSYDRPET
ncbi:SDR family NAD(P)-dependent oxidoreductase [Prauserella cavernicola]|uniref:SDR family oxidoreductase n=1 Tax=Prauserella cavernicola TaxID=2800127 RepID=A0A934QZ60_9PSEU|nr:SDR family oxidoreductase [Prauserella cavernicola]MBK1789450.1 SDR family oxidoreductase [Prauserella cavernicola]